MLGRMRTRRRQLRLIVISGVWRYKLNGGKEEAMPSAKGTSSKERKKTSERER